MPYGLIYSARTVCIEHCLHVNHVCITLCEELNDDAGDDDCNSRSWLQQQQMTGRHDGDGFVMAGRTGNEAPCCDEELGRRTPPA